MPFFDFPRSFKKRLGKIPTELTKHYFKSGNSIISKVETKLY